MFSSRIEIPGSWFLKEGGGDQPGMGVNWPTGLFLQLMGESEMDEVCRPGRPKDTQDFIILINSKCTLILG